MKILACSLTYPLPNGVTASLKTSRKGFQDLGHSFNIVAPDYGIEEEGLVTLPSLPLPGQKERIFSPMAHNIIGKFNPDVYWLHTVSPIEHSFEVKMRKLSVLTYHTYVEYHANLVFGLVGSSLMRSRSRDLCNRMDLVIAPTEAVKILLREYQVRSRIEVVPTGIDQPTESYSRQDLIKKFNLPDDKPLVMYCGRISPEKNPSLLVKAIKEVPANFLIVSPEVNFSFPNCYPITNLNRDEVRKCYAGVDLLILPSASETQSLVVGEALSVGTRVVKVKSLLQPEHYALAMAVDEENFVSAIKQEMIKGKQSSYVFTTQEMIEKQVALFQELGHNDTRS